jgi:hypothetical protein
MEGILKQNDIATIGGTVPQGEGIEIVGNIKDWVIVKITNDEDISSIQEFNIQPVEDGFAEATNGPQQEGAADAPAYKIEGFGDKMRFENNSGFKAGGGLDYVKAGTELRGPDVRNDKDQKNFNSEDVKPYKQAYGFIKKYNAKSVLRNQIRGNIVDVEDDIADTKVAMQMALYYFAHEWQTRTEVQKGVNKNRVNMEKLANKLLSDDVQMRADLSNGITSINDIVEKEALIEKFVSENYKYDSSRGN